MTRFINWTARSITYSLLALCFGFVAAQAAEDSNKRIVWWDWQPDGDGLEMCPIDPNDPCLEFRKLTNGNVCRNISGDFENVADGMAAEQNNSLTVKFFTCDIDQPQVGVMCVDTGEDGGFEACGLVGKSALASFTSAKRKSFELKKRPKK